MKVLTANSISDVMGFVSQIRKEWHLPIGEELWFRGEDARHQQSTLQPKLYRHLSPKTSQIPLALLKEENILFDEFRRCGTQLYDHERVDRWDWYFLMQHHGAPTRLLDWSDGFLMATHFAVSGDPDTSLGGIVYVVDPFNLVDQIDELPQSVDFENRWKEYRRTRKKKNKKPPGESSRIYIPGLHSVAHRPTTPGLPDFPLVMEFPHITRRVAAQRSRFMAYGRDKSWLTSWAKKPDSRIQKIVIPRKSLRLVRTQLRDAGMTESVIFPDLDGLGREIDQLWNTLKKKRSLNPRSG